MERNDRQFYCTITEGNVTVTYPEIQFGDYTFSKDSIKSAALIEEFDMSGLTLPASSLEVMVYSADADFSIFNPQRSFYGFAKNQPVNLYEYVNDQRIYLGLYFLSDWENTNETLNKLFFVDQIGYLESSEFLGGIWITPISLKSLIKLIADSAGVTIYIDPEIENIELSGWLPISNCREALQQVVFAAGAYALSSRLPGYIKIGKIGSASNIVNRGPRCGMFTCGQSYIRQEFMRYATWDLSRSTIEITRTQILSSFSIEQRKYVSGVNITSHNYSAGTDSVNLFDGVLSVGEHVIKFNAPAHTLTATGATIINSGANYAVLDVTADGAVTLSGKSYIDSLKPYSIIDSTDNVLSVSNATLISMTNAQEITQKVYTYYQSRLIQKAGILPIDVILGDNVKIEAYNSQRLRGYVEKSSVDLHSGFIANIEVVGDLYIPTVWVFCGMGDAGQSRIRQRNFVPGIEN